MSKKVISLWMAAIVLVFTNFIWLKPMLTMRVEQPKATWLWHTSQIIEQPGELITFLDKNNVNTLYLQINTDLPIDVYQKFIQQAGSYGIEVHALDGAPHWTSKRQPVENFFRWVEKYQSVSEKTAQFTGIHLDIEPYILPSWGSDNQKTIENFQQTIQYAEEEASMLGLHLGVDIAFWFDTSFYSNSFGEGVLSEWLIDHSDSVSVMAYRNKAKGRNGIIALSQNEVDYARSVGKDIRIAAETSKTAEGDHLTFFGKKNAYMNNHLREVEGAFNHSDHFKGIAIHSLESWMQRK
ncbi:amidase [Sporosarcina sp. PTS2304]|uniref:amidase n=1 Tax=Sporosarcina sp. PTS2304 TaxID=2283194 RepID=UPI000E0D2512|nr:amidase [Sporosarcina sp. PTS2304]AXI00136.1 amidase [Sporosarcina sp. PTS2304]